MRKLRTRDNEIYVYNLTMNKRPNCIIAVSLLHEWTVLLKTNYAFYFLECKCTSVYN